MNKSKSLETSSLATSKVVFNFSSLERIASPLPSVHKRGSVDDSADESKVSSQQFKQPSAPDKEKEAPQQGKIAEGASQSTSDKSSSDKVKAAKTDSQAEGNLQDSPSQRYMQLKATAIEIFIRTLRINTDLLNGTHKNNHYELFLELLTFDDSQTTIKNLLSSKETTSGVAIHCIPQFFFHEYVFHSNKGIERVFNKLMRLNRDKSKNLKQQVENQLRQFAGLVSLDDTYQGIPVYFYVKYYKKDSVFSEELPEPSLELIPLSDTAISAEDYLAFETALQQANAPFIADIDEGDYSEASKSAEANHSADSEETGDQLSSSRKPIRKEHDNKAQYQENLPHETVVSLYSLCRISDLHQILESYIDMWYDEEFKKQLKHSTSGFAKNRDAIVSKVAQFEKSRDQRLNECRFFLNDLSSTNELASALNLVEHRLQKMCKLRKSRLQDLLQAKIQSIRKEEFFQQNQGDRLTIYNNTFPDLSYLTEIREMLTKENKNKELSLKNLRGENGGLEHQKKKLLAENKSLKDDNQRKQESIKILERDNQGQLETITSLERDKQSKLETIANLERDKQSKLETIANLERDKQRQLETIKRQNSKMQEYEQTILKLLRSTTHQESDNSQRFFGRDRNGRGGEVVEVRSDSEKDETSSENDGQYVFYDATQADNM